MSSSARHHFVRPSRSGRWLVVYVVPGTRTLHVATSCVTLAGALEEAERLNGGAIA